MPNIQNSRTIEELRANLEQYPTEDLQAMKEEYNRQTMSTPRRVGQAFLAAGESAIRGLRGQGPGGPEYQRLEQDRLLKMKAAEDERQGLLHSVC